MCVGRGYSAGKGAQHCSPPKGMGGQHRGLRGCGCGIHQQEKQWLEQRRRNNDL